jgi:hypothetical protein
MASQIHTTVHESLSSGSKDVYRYSVLKAAVVAIVTLAKDNATIPLLITQQ